MMKRFLIRISVFSLLIIVPYIIIILLYCHFDPFKVVKTYDDYSHLITMANRDYISTSMFLKKHKKYKYNSFIFGSSRTSGFKPRSWTKNLSENSVPFMFDASNESIYGIFRKIRYLDSIKASLSNVLIIIDRDATFNYSENQKSHLYMEHPATSGESMLTFQYTFFRAYLNPKFLSGYYAYKILGEYKQFMSGYIDTNKITFDTITNEMVFPNIEYQLIHNPSLYYQNNKDLFYARKGERTDTVERINEKHIIMLKEIKRILEKNNTKYRLVISPTYDQIKFSEADIVILKDIFSNNLYDFSGKNFFTDSITNYYEASHYRPHVGDSIFRIIYYDKE